MDGIDYYTRGVEETVLEIINLIESKQRIDKDELINEIKKEYKTEFFDLTMADVKQF